MKKLIFAFATMIAMTFASCGNKVNDVINVDTLTVDTLVADTFNVDTVIISSLIVE